MQYPHELEIKFPTWMGLEPMQDYGLTILSARVQVPSKLEILFLSWLHRFLFFQRKYISDRNIRYVYVLDFDNNFEVF